MEVRQGYKETEIGVLPNDWTITRLGNIADIKDGTHQTPKYVPFGIPFYSVEQVTKNDFKNTKYISEEEHKALSHSFKIEKGDILMTRIGSIGECKLIDWDVNASFYVSLALLKVHGADPKYIEQYSKSTQFIQETELHSLPAAIPKKINLGPISDIRIATPPHHEQSAIATALNDMDSLLESLNSLIAKKRAIKQATMQQLLSGETRVSSPQNDWTDTTLGEIVERFVGGGTPSRTVADYWGGNIPWVSTKDFASFSPYTSQESITKKGLKNSAASLIPAKTLLISTRMAVGRTAIYKVDVAINQDIKALIPRAHISQRFLLHWLNHNNHKISSTSNGSTVSGISITDLKRIKIKIPDIHEQNSIARILDDLDYDISILESRIHKTNSLKQAMMQELLTGRTRLI
jgi:fclIS